MNLQFYLEKLKDSIEYKNFKKENSKAYFAGAFLAIDVENNGTGDEQHIDFYVGDKKEMFSFCISNQCQKTPINLVDGEKIPEKISEGVDFDIDEIKKIIEKKMEKEKIKNKLQRILLSLQKRDGENFLIGTVFISSLGMIKFGISLDEKKIIHFEKKSIFDMVRRVK